MKCPYCSEEMKAGNLFPLSSKASDAIYWLPEQAKIPGLFLNEKKICDCGGFVLAENVAPRSATPEKGRVYHCENCKILLTKLEE